MPLRARSSFLVVLLIGAVSVAALTGRTLTAGTRESSTQLSNDQISQNATVTLTPQDTTLNLDAQNHSALGQLTTYTWPDYKVANAVAMTFDLSAVPAGALIEKATLHLALVQSDASADATYDISVHKLVGKNLVVAKATGQTSDGVTAWTANPCCHNGVPLAQADISGAYDTQAIDKAPGVKIWNVTALVQEWLQVPASNFGLLLNSDASKPRDRYRYFASMEHLDPGLRPFLQVTFVAPDATPPVVAVTVPGDGAPVSGTVALAASATDASGVASVQFLLNGAPLGSAVATAPYVVSWDTTTVSDGAYTLAAVATDGVGNTSVSAAVSMTVKNGILWLSPRDTSLLLDAVNYSSRPRLFTYTWPDYKVANAIVMKFNLTAVPPGAVIQDARLQLALVASDQTTDAIYTISAHKIVGRNPVIGKATGYTADGVVSWTSSACCYNGVPMAQADISPALDRSGVDKAPGFKAWTITTMVQDWLQDPASNFGLLLNADASKPRDRYRYFASMEHADPALHPRLRIAYYVPPTDSTPPTVVIAAPLSGTTVAEKVLLSASATDDTAVAGVYFQRDGAPLCTDLTRAPYAYEWDTSSVPDGDYSVTAVARDTSGNVATSPAIAVRVRKDKTPPVISGVTASAVTSSGATIAWTTDEASDTQVEYGRTTAYGGVTPLNSNLTTSHAATLSGLADAALYHFRVRSRDAAGNVATSADFTFTTPDGTKPSVSITAPAAGSTVSGAVTVAATASDNVGVAGVQFKLDGVNLGAEDTTAPYTAAWDTRTAAAGGHTLTAVARDAAGHTSSAAVNVTVANSVQVSLVPKDTYLNLNATNNSTQTQLMTYTWPDNRVANAILLKFDLSGIPAGVVVQEATLQLALVASDATLDDTYAVSAHKIVGKDPLITAATGYTADGVTSWAANTCCHNNVPLAQADISPAYDTRAVDKAPGYKTWSITSMVQEWVANPATNFGLLLNSDASKLRDRYRGFASTEHLDATLRPVLRVTYAASADTTRPSVAITAPVAGATVSGTVMVAANATDNVGVAGVQFKLDGVNLGAEDTTAPFSVSWNTTAILPGVHTLRAVARDAAGNETISPGVDVVVPDITAPTVSITAPTAGATVSGTVSVAASAADLVGVVGVQFKVDGVNLGVEDTAAPYSASWNTTTLADGSHTLTAVARDAAGNQRTSTAVAVTVTNTVPPASTAWTHEPGGFTVIEETGWESGTLGNWYRIFTSGDKPINVRDISGSLLGESKALQIDYAAGHVGGGGTELRYDIAPANRSNELYVGFYVQVNSQWQGHSSGINKMIYLHDGGGSFAAMWYEMFGSGSNPLDLYVVNQSGSGPAGFRENVNEITFARGQWHKVEIYQKQGSANNGVVRVWVNDVLAIDRSDVDTTSNPVDNVTISGIWGGVGDSKSNADYMRFDRIRISRPGAAITPAPTGVTLIQENFEDANLASRGWYDDTTALLSTAERVAGSLRSLEYKFNAGSTTPTAAVALRRKFTPTDSVYLSYWVKYSTNWVGSQKPYHPHEFHFLTNLDGDWSGLSFTRLTAYIEQNGGTPLIGIQDGANVDQARVGQDLTLITERRGVAGCNGSSDGYADNCYRGGSGYVNEKKWTAPTRYFTDASGAFYKSDWHFVEAYIKMNTVSGGKGLNDGIVQYWFDGQLVIDRRNVLLRTGANATMQFDKLVIAPYIGDGSPVTQSFWIDNLTVRTARP